MTDRPFHIVLSVLGIVAGMLFALLFGPESGTRWVSLLFAGAFATSLLPEIAAAAWQASKSPTVRGVLLASFAGAGVVIFAAVAFLLGWEPAVFLLLFVAIWHVAGSERPVHA